MLWNPSSLVFVASKLERLLTCTSADKQATKSDLIITILFSKLTLMNLIGSPQPIPQIMTNFNPRTFIFLSYIGRTHGHETDGEGIFLALGVDYHPVAFLEGRLCFAVGWHFSSFSMGSVHNAICETKKAINASMQIKFLHSTAVHEHMSKQK